MAIIAGSRSDRMARITNGAERAAMRAEKEHLLIML